MAEFDRDKCQQRNRLAARRDGAEGMPMRLLAQSPADAATVFARPDTDLLYAQGTLPSSETDALARINALLPADAAPLTADDVYLHYLEAANDNFIADRYMFMTDRTLRNIAHDANAGVAFMNSHRDGGLSHPAELPMGKTFAGRYEQTTDGRKRALVGFYMLRGVYPNGQGAPSTDDLHRTIVGGTTADASVGLYGGDKVCDVCGNDVNDYKLCTHSPGTHTNMTPDQRKAQDARGVTKGRASYSLDAAHMGEVSAVYDGAVPGAGFTKTLALARRHQLSRADLLAASQVYARLLRKGDLQMDELKDVVAEGVEEGMTRSRRRRSRADQLATVQGLDRTVPGVLLSQAQPEPLLDADRQRFDQERAAFAAEKAAFAQQQHWATAELAVATLIQAGIVLPAENLPNLDGQPELTAVFADVLGRDAALYTRLLARYEARAPHPVVGGMEQIPITLLPTGTTGPTPADHAEREHKLLALTPTGQAALKHKGAN